MQLTYPGARISTQKEVFDFVACADPHHRMRFNIESKINAQSPNATAAVDEFVTRQLAVFQASPYRNQITVSSHLPAAKVISHDILQYQSFDWRTLVAMKKVKRSQITSALIDAYVGLL
jgi:hypothetical protein